MELSGYSFSLLRAGDLTLYRGCCNGAAPILLVSANGGSLACLERLEHENALKLELDVAWAARPMELCRYHDSLALVLEDPGGELLERLLGRPLELTRFLRIAIPLSSALRGVHERGLVHRDIKPANVLADLAGGGAWLTGFGIASRLPREHRSPAPPRAITGTLAYMAPEQTGRMNRSIDARSDLYSLGVTFYEMLTGTLPFEAGDPFEWVHCHIARQPPPPSERVPAVPLQLSAIVMKLLAKTPEERYQTAAGLEADLLRCLAEAESHGHIGPFPLGTQDVSDRLVISEKLYGREREIEALVAAFDRVVAHGTPELVLVSGYSGIGKSSVVHELHRIIVPARGLFASGKFDQYQRDVPYATLGQAFRGLVRALLVQSEGDLGRWRDSLRAALGSNAQIIVNLVPELELVIGAQPPIPALHPQNAKNHFQRVFRCFLGVFARQEHPLVLFLDDLQWLDAATFELLEYLVTHADVRHLLLIGAYRDTEVSLSHPLTRLLDAIRSANAHVHEIVLAPLELHDFGRLVAEALHCDPEQARPLAHLIHQKTGGNPFFGIYFFVTLIEEGLVTFDPVARVWTWSIDRIRAKSFTDNVVDLMAEKLMRLSASTQEALKHLACLGNVAELATLALVHADTEEALHGALWEAVRAGLIFQQDSTYKFLHDRIQQAAYSLIPEAQRAAVHSHIGRVLLASMTEDQLAEHLFDVANQLNRGGALLIDRDERVQVATLDLRAGRKAKASTAFASACAYLEAGTALLDEGDWSNQYDLMFSLWLDGAECAFLSGDFQKTGQLMVELLQRAASKVDQAAVYDLQVRLHEVNGKYAQAVASALQCLKLFGIDIPAHPTQEQVEVEYQAVWQVLDGRPIESLIDLPLMTDAEVQAAMQVLSGLTPSAYFTDARLGCLQICRMVKIGMRYGTSGASALAYGYFGNILGPVFHRYPEGYRFVKLASDLIEKHGFIALQAKIYHLMGHVTPWTQPLASVIELCRRPFALQLRGVICSTLATV